MNRTVRRAIATFSVTAVATVLVASPASAADPQAGLGSTGGATRVVTIDLGELLNSIVAGEGNGTSTDTSIATPNAFEHFIGLTAQAPTPPLDVTAGEAQTSTTGAQDQQNSPAVDIGSETAALPGLLDGTVDAATLKSIVDAAGAVSTLESSVSDVQALADLVHVDAADLAVNGSTTPTNALASRSASVDGVHALTVGNFLELLGVQDLHDLSLISLVHLIEHLGLLDENTDPGVNTFFAIFDAAEENIANLTDQIAQCNLDPDCVTNDLAGLNSDLLTQQFLLEILLVIADNFVDEG